MHQYVHERHSFANGNEIGHRQNVADDATDQREYCAGNAKSLVDAFAGEAHRESDQYADTHGQPADLILRHDRNDGPDTGAEQCRREASQRAGDYVLLRPQGIHGHLHLLIGQRRLLSCLRIRFDFFVHGIFSSINNKDASHRPDLRNRP